MQDVQHLAPYRAVVAGSAIREQKWLPEAVQFIQTHRAALAQKPFATFTVCITMAMKNQKYHQVVAEWVAPVRALVKPVSEGFFAGALDISKAPTFRNRLMFRVSVLLGVSEGDHRDCHSWLGEQPGGKLRHSDQARLVINHRIGSIRAFNTAMM
jgi:menaquinone-dependent protoporphyrinogen oxidase